VPLANRLQFLSRLLGQFWLQVSKTRREEEENIGRTGGGKIRIKIKFFPTRHILVLRIPIH
jgi:hypothetical protein